MARRWLRSLHFDPPDEPGPAILESVIGSHAGPEHVARMQHHRVPVDERVNFALTNT